MRQRDHPEVLVAMLQPTHYTSYEGGPFIKFPAEFYTVDEDLLGRREKQYIPLRARDPGYILILHSLKWADGREWNCVNGWREK